MTTRPSVSNHDDLIDSRDVDTALAALYDAQAAGEAVDLVYLGDLERFATDGAEQCVDWPYGEVLVRDSYFVDYARDLAEDCGYLPKDLTWPLVHIDWEAAARALQDDYTALRFGAVTYWGRA